MEALKLEKEEIFATYFDKTQEVHQFKSAQDSNMDIKLNLIAHSWP